MQQCQKVRNQSYQREKRERQREDDPMRMLEKELGVQYQLINLRIATGYVEPDVQVLEDEFKLENDVFN